VTLIGRDLQLGVDSVLKDLPEDRREDVRQLIANQITYFEQCAKDGGTWGHNSAMLWSDTFTKFGDDWIARFLGALIAEAKKAHFWDLLDFKVAKTKFEKATYAFYNYDATGTVSLRFQDVETQIRPRKGPRIEWGDDLACDWNGTRRAFIRDEMWPMWANEIFLEITRDFLAEMSAAARNHGFVLTSKKDLLWTIECESVALHRHSGAGPGNKLVMGGELALTLPVKDRQYHPGCYGIQRFGKLNDQWDVYVDPRFPPHEVVLWHHANLVGHSGMLGRLFMLTLPGHLASTRIQMSKHLLNDKFFSLLRVQ
jgi:hypothetical protein